MGPWVLEFLTTKTFITPIVLKDELGEPIDIDGWFFAIEVEHDDGVLTYSTESGHFAIAAPTDGKVILTVQKAEIADLPFEWAAFRFYAGPTPDEADLLYEGKARRR
jgi:hypothetical protein